MSNPERTKENLAKLAAKAYFSALLRYRLTEDDDGEHHWFCALEDVAKEYGYNMVSCQSCGRPYLEKKPTQ